MQWVFLIMAEESIQCETQIMHIHQQCHVIFLYSNQFISLFGHIGPNYLNQHWLIVNWTLRNKLNEIRMKFCSFQSIRLSSKYRLYNGGPFVRASMRNAPTFSLATWPYPLERQVSKWISDTGSLFPNDTLLICVGRGHVGLVWGEGCNCHWRAIWTVLYM